MLVKKHKIGGMSGMNEQYPVNHQETRNTHQRTWSVEDEYDPFTLEAVSRLRTEENTDIDIVADEEDVAVEKQLDCMEVLKKAGVVSLRLQHDGFAPIGAVALVGGSNGL